MLFLWRVAVAVDMPRVWATSVLVWPRASRAMTSRSRGDRLAKLMVVLNLLGLQLGATTHHRPSGRHISAACQNLVEAHGPVGARSALTQSGMGMSNAEGACRGDQAIRLFSDSANCGVNARVWRTRLICLAMRATSYLQGSSV